MNDVMDDLLRWLRNPCAETANDVVVLAMTEIRRLRDDPNRSQCELGSLFAEVGRLRKEVERLRKELETCRGEVERLRPTAEERGALRDAISFYLATADLTVNDSPICRTLRGLLARLYNK